MAAKRETLPHLFDTVQAKFPKSLGPHSWYLVAASALITNSPPSNFGQLWTYLIQQPEYQTPEERRALNKRLREFLLKQWVTIGVPKIAIAAFALIKEEKPGDADLGFSKAHSGITPANRERGVEFLSYLYTEEQMKAMWSSWGGDFEWLTKDIVYGMFYGDDTILRNVDTELITYTAIVSLGLGVTVPNHLRGLLGMGLSVEEIEGVTECGRIVAEWSGVDTSVWPDVKGIAAEVQKREQITFE